MTKEQQEIQSRIWEISNKVHAARGGWDYKQFMMTALFYRFISENFTRFMQGGESVDYASYRDHDISSETIDDAIRTKGYFIYPSQLFENVARNASDNKRLSIELKDIFEAIEGSAVGYPSENAIKGLLTEIDVSSARLGSSMEDVSSRLATVIVGIRDLYSTKNDDDNKMDRLGDVYEYLLANYSSDGGSWSGEFFTPFQFL